MAFIDRSVKERILLVGVIGKDRASCQVEEDLDELEALVDTAGALAVGRFIRRREVPDPSTYLGAGQLQELAKVCEELDVDTVVFDVPLRPAQQANLEGALGRTAIDRTAVILDIFAQNARSTEGKNQVELALLRYRLARLRGKGKQLSRLAGGIGTRGPGESQLEVDRRQIKRRIARLEAALEELAQRRATQRQLRKRHRIPEIALVGYTNAGKSSMLNALTHAYHAHVEDRLFSTLDPKTRRLALPGVGKVLLTDTVGFLKNLPHELIEAFHSTLEQVVEADVVLHVVDSSAPNVLERIEIVREVLRRIGAEGVPEVLALNKADLSREVAYALAAKEPDAVAVSCKSGEGLEELALKLAEVLKTAGKEVALELAGEL